MSSAATTRPSTTSALYHDGTTIYFNDLVYEDDPVDVFRTEAEAMKGEGWCQRMRVRRDGDVWWLEPMPPARRPKGHRGT